MLEIFLIFLAVLALLSIILEERTRLNKAKTTLFLGCVAWIILFVAAADPEQGQLVAEQLDENLLEIATLWLFLMSTMTFVAYLNAKGMIQVMVRKIFPRRLTVRMLMVQMAFFALLLSAFCDNVTATLVSLGLLTTFPLETSLRQRMAVLIIFSVNSGGVSLITGDVTTLMIFLSGHVSISQLLLLFVPATAGVLLLVMLLSRGVQGEVSATPMAQRYEPVDVAIAVIFLATILATMALNILFGIPPVLTFLTGLSVMFLVGHGARSATEETRILEYIRQVEFETLLFFLGILLLVGMLKTIGALDSLTALYVRFGPSLSSYGTGMVSALIDNVPLTAALLKADPDLSTAQWLGLTYAVGVGGSLLVIGSAAGIVAMSRVRELTFGSYLRYVPALLLAYSVGYGLTLVLAGWALGPETQSAAGEPLPP